MTRLALLLAVVSLLSGCSFESYARRSNIYPGAYDRAVEHAALTSPELAAELEKLGRRTSYNSGTHDLLWCLDGYAEGLRWRRQYEKRDLMNEEALIQSVYAKYGKVPDYKLKDYEPDLSLVKQPELGWATGMRRCVETCGELAKGKSFEKPKPEDVELAKTYLARCQQELAAADALVKSRKEREVADHAAKDLDTAEGKARDGHWLSFAAFLEQAERDARKIVGDANLGKPVLERAAALRQKHADGLAKVDAYRNDPRLAQLERQQRSLETDLALVNQSIAEADRIIQQTGSSTSYDTVRGGSTYHPGNPEVHDRYVERKQLLWRKKNELLAAQRDVDAAFAAVQDEHGVR